MRKAIVTAVVLSLLLIVGCQPSLFITQSETAPDGSKFWSVVTKTNGHPAVTGTQTFRQQGDGPGTLVADHAGSAKGAAVDIASSTMQNTGAALALGLPASQLRPDTTNVGQSTSQNANPKFVNKPTTTATGGAGGSATGGTAFGGAGGSGGAGGAGGLGGQGGTATGVKTGDIDINGGIHF